MDNLKGNLAFFKVVSLKVKWTKHANPAWLVYCSCSLLGSIHHRGKLKLNYYNQSYLNQSYIIFDEQTYPIL